MIRVKENSCGYSGYKCVGVGTLADINRSFKLVHDPDVDRTDPGSFASGDGNYIDNYLDLPTAVAGLHTSVADIPVFSSLRAPESDCRNNTDPFTDGGFLDCYSIQEVQDNTTGKAFEADKAVKLSAQNIAFVNAEGTEGEFQPGVLEPILDTEFKPVGMDFNSSMDSLLDGVMMSLMSITKWRDIIDRKFNNLAKLRGVSLRSLFTVLGNMNRSTPCKSFKIHLAGGSPVRYPGDTNTPSYRVDGGSVRINGTEVPVAARTFSMPSAGDLYIYLRITTTANLQDQQEAAFQADFTTAEPGGAYEYGFGIGGVKRIEHEGYVLWQIYQDECLTSLDIVNTSEGFIYRKNGSPRRYIAYKPGKCDEQSV